MPRDFPAGFVTVAALCFLSSTDWAGAIRVEIQNWVFDLIGAPGDSRALIREIIPKIPHVALFGLLGCVAALEVRDGWRWWLFAASVVVAVAAELAQILTSTRELTAGDLTVNILSVTIVFWSATCLRDRIGPVRNP